MGNNINLMFKYSSLPFYKFLINQNRKFEVINSHPFFVISLFIKLLFFVFASPGITLNLFTPFIEKTFLNFNDVLPPEAWIIET